MPYLMRDKDGNACPECGGSGRLRNLATLSPADDEPCPCTDVSDDDAAAAEREAVARNWL